MYDNREDPLAEEDALKIPEGCEYFTTARSTGSTTHGKLGRHLMNHRKEKTELYAMFPKLRKGYKEIENRYYAISVDRIVTYD